MLILFITLLIAAMAVSELHLAGWRIQFQRRKPRHFVQPKNTFRNVS